METVHTYGLRWQICAVCKAVAKSSRWTIKLKTVWSAGAHKPTLIKSAVNGMLACTPTLSHRPAYNFAQKSGARDSWGGLRRAEEGWGEQMQMQVCQGRPLMQLLMQITTALYLAITLSSFDASSLFQTWQNKRKREERRYIQPPEKTPQVFGLLLENVKSNQSLSQVPQPTCFFKLGGDPVYQTLCVCLSGSAPVIVK